MKKILMQYAAYSVWANKKLLEVIAGLPQEQQQRAVASSFAGLQKTLLHMWNAESTWWQRMKPVEGYVLPVLLNPSIEKIINGLQQQNEDWYNWVASADETELAEEFAYQNSKKEEFKQPMFQVLLHLFNHSTYHRGQLVTILRQLGIESIPATDFIVWSRSVA